MNWLDALGNAGAGATPVLERGRQLQLERDRMAQQNAQFNQQLGLQQQGLDLSKAQQAMAQETHGLQMPMLQRQNAAAKRQDELMDGYRQLSVLQARAAAGEDPVKLARDATTFYSDHPSMQNGDYAKVADLNGQPHIVNGGIEGPTHATPINGDTIKGYLGAGLDHLRQQIATTSPEALASYNAAQTQAAQHAESMQMQRESWRNNAADRAADRQAMYANQLAIAKLHYGAMQGRGGAKDGYQLAGALDDNTPFYAVPGSMTLYKRGDNGEAVPLTPSEHIKAHKGLNLGKPQGPASDPEMDNINHYGQTNPAEAATMRDALVAKRAAAAKLSAGGGGDRYGPSKAQMTGGRAATGGGLSSRAATGEGGAGDDAARQAAMAAAQPAWGRGLRSLYENRNRTPFVLPPVDPNQQLTE